MYLLNFNKLALSDGSVVGSRYISNLVWAESIDSTQIGSNIVSLVLWTNYMIMITNTSSYTFTFKTINPSIVAYDIEIEPLTEK